MTKKALLSARTIAPGDTLSTGSSRLRLLRFVLLVKAMFLVGTGPTYAEIISSHSEAAGDLILSLMRRLPIKDPEAKWARRDDCLHQAKVNRIYLDTNILSTCMLGTTQKTKTGGSRPKQPLSEKKKPLEKKVNVDPDPDWAVATRERILKGEKRDTISVTENLERVAPYGSPDCAKITPSAKRGQIDWDAVVVENVCSYPIKVLTCYYEKGREETCVAKRGAQHWGQSNLLQPGASQDSVMFNVSQTPAKAKIVVCDMRQKSDLLCVLPK